MLRVLFLPTGRAPRLIFACFAFGIMAIFYTMKWFMLRPENAELLFVWGPRLNVIATLLAWPLFCLTVSRLHDIGRSGWPALIYTFNLFLFAAYQMPAIVQTLPLSDISDGVAAIKVILSLVLIFPPGTPGVNAYGPPLKKPARAAVDIF